VLASTTNIIICRRPTRTLALATTPDASSGRLNSHRDLGDETEGRCLRARRISSEVTAVRSSVQHGQLLFAPRFGALSSSTQLDTTHCQAPRHPGTAATSLDWFIGPFLGSDRQVVAGHTGYTTSDCRQRTWSIPQPSAATAPRLRPFSTSYDFYYNSFASFIFGFARVGFGADAA
jgi:hypothetical protein